MPHVRANIWKLYVCTFLTELLFLAVVIVPFLGGTGLTMQQILLTETFFAASNLVFEIPSGYFADIFGRKISLIIGAAAWIIGTAFYAISYSFEYFLVGAVIWGIGTSFNSGAQEALMYETLVKVGRENDYKKIQGDLMFYGRIASIIGGIKYAKEIEERVGARLSLFLIPLFPIVIWIVFANTRTLLVLPLFVVVPAIWGFSMPVFQDFVQKLLPSDRRATVLSIMSFFRRGVFFVFAPFLGWVTDTYSIQTAFLVSAVILFVFSTISLFMLKQVKII